MQYIILFPLCCNVCFYNLFNFTNYKKILLKVTFLKYTTFELAEQFDSIGNGIFKYRIFSTNDYLYIGPILYKALHISWKVSIRLPWKMCFFVTENLLRTPTVRISVYNLPGQLLCPSIMRTALQIKPWLLRRKYWPKISSLE